MKGKKAQASGINKTVMIIIAIIVLLLVLLFVFRAQINQWIASSPSAEPGEDQEIDVSGTGEKENSIKLGNIAFCIKPEYQNSISVTTISDPTDKDCSSFGIFLGIIGNHKFCVKDDKNELYHRVIFGFGSNQICYYDFSLTNPIKAGGLLEKEVSAIIGTPPIIVNGFSAATTGKNDVNSKEWLSICVIDAYAKNPPIYITVDKCLSNDIELFRYDNVGFGSLDMDVTIRTVDGLKNFENYKKTYYYNPAEYGQFLGLRDIDLYYDSGLKQPADIYISKGDMKIKVVT